MVTDYEAYYIPVTEICPSQHRYASLNVRDKIKKAENNGYHYENGEVLFHFDNGNSIYSLKNAIPVLKMGGTYVLCDGHHSVLASLEMGAKTIPIKMLEAINGDLDQKFWEWAALKNYAYLVDMKGEIVIPPPKDITQLQDDPLRYFAAITAQKFEEGMTESWTKIKHPLWIKIGKDIPFIEMRIADTLRRHDFSYQYGDEAEGLDSLIDQARLILKTDPIPGLNLA